MIMAAQPPNHPQPFNLPSSPFFTPSTPSFARKRRAASPESPTVPIFGNTDKHQPISPWTANQHFSPDEASFGSEAQAPQQHREKRRRPNLANGFMSLSISRDQLLKNGSGASTNDNGNGNAQLKVDHYREDTSGEEEDEGIGLTRINNNDIKVEVLPDRTESRTRSHHQHNDRHHSNVHHWSIPNHAGPSSSSSSPSPTESSEENYDSDVTFTRSFPNNKHRRYAGVAQQADEVQQPDAQQAETQDQFQNPFESDRYPYQDLSVEDVTVPTPLGSRRRREDDQGAGVGPKGKRARREGEMDVDMGDDGDIEELQRDFVDKRRKRKTVWHEPEKDRIVITSLSDASSSRGSSRSSSPDQETDSAEELRRLSQPGDQGFMLSPSLLTHLLKAQRNQFNGDSNNNHAGNNNSLILYRPLGINPGKANEPTAAWTDDNSDSVVRNWQPGETYVDSGRFEEVDDDERFDEPAPAQAEDMDMGMGMDIDDDGDVAMD
ncbi:hypothetical protein IAU59_001925 [Kwoniella sp. CBS 9459]